MRAFKWVFVCVLIAGCGGGGDSGDANTMGGNDDLSMVGGHDDLALENNPDLLVVPPGRYLCPLSLPQKVYGQAANAPETLAGDETWTPDNVYLVFGILSTGGHTLTIQAGTRVCFDYETLPPAFGEPAPGELDVELHGSLQVLGTAANHVVFTQKNDFHQYYTGISFKTGFNANTTLQNLDVYNAGLSAGGPAIATFPSTMEPALDLQNVTFHSIQKVGLKILTAGLTPASRVLVSEYADETADLTNQYSVIEMDPVGAATLSDTVFQVGDAVPAPVRHVAMHQFQITTSLTWHKLAIPYQFISSQKIAAGVGKPPAVLTLEAGTTVMVSSDHPTQVGDSVNNKGDLVAVGTMQDPIVFTSSELTPKAGDWNAIIFIPGSFDPKTTRFDHVRFEYGGGGGPNPIFSCQDMSSMTQGELEFDTPLVGGDFAGPSITNTTFTQSAGNGIRGYCNIGPTNCLATDYTKPDLNNTFDGFTNDLPGQTPLGCP